MTSELPRPVEPASTHEFSPPTEFERARRRACVALVLSILAFLYGGYAGKSIPGGPYFSVTSDILPIVFAVTAIWLCLRLLRRVPLGWSVLSLVVIMIATMAIEKIIHQGIDFRGHPNARGDWFGL